MNKKQATFILVAVVAGLVVPWFSVGMFFMGLAVGAFVSIIIS